MSVSASELDKSGFETKSRLLESREGSWWAAAAFALVPVIAWVGLVAKLSTDWSTNAQYEFGFFVPWFVAYLLWRRWVSRPSGAPDTFAKLAPVVGSVLLLLMLPMRIIQEANPDWRPFNWLHAAIVVTISLVPFGYVGGGKWIRYFAPPFVLLFSALPWPLATEQAVLQALSATVTTFTVELLNIVGIPALQRGNVIDLAIGSVGVEDACSGIRSLAGTLMASLFFGEFYRLGIGRRILLIASACIVAFVLNLFRAFFLSWRASVEGLQSIDRWHDPAGFTIFAVSFAALWGLANLASRNHFIESEAGTGRAALPKARWGWIAAAAAWAVAVGLVSNAWYEMREGQRPDSVVWDVRWPAIGQNFEFTPVPDETRSILRYTTGQSAQLKWQDGSLWRMFFFHWAPGRTSVQLATMHRPEVCLPAVGFRYVGETKPLDISTTGLVLPFTGSAFYADGSQVFVYRCLWEDYPISELTRNRNFDLSIKGRLLAAWYGRRNLGQRMLQVAVMGGGSEQDVAQQLRDRLTGMIQLR